MWAIKMRGQKLVVLGIISAMVLSGIFFVIPIETSGSSGTTLYVGGSGPGNYSSIQSAIDNSNDGDTIYVYGGTYIENIVIDKKIRLIGEDRNDTIIDGGGQSDTVYISSSNVIVKNFTITRSASSAAGVDIEKSTEDNVVWYCTIKNCKIYHNYDGILCYSWGDAVYHNFIDNYISENLEDGIDLVSGDNIIRGNTIVGNGEKGIRIFGGDDNRVEYNFISNNRGDFRDGGIYLEHTSRTEICYNYIGCNPDYGIYLTESSASIHHNNILDNGDNARDNYYNYWDDGSEGNYWGDYNGNDGNGDGIGETPYNILGGYAQDRYPLVEPVEDAPRPPNESPNTPSQPSGSSSGYTGTSYSYSTSATDPDGDQVKYYFDWGDGTGTWTNLVNSGQSASKSHSWNNAGTYNVKVKAQDENGAESGWSTAKGVTITVYTPPPPPPNQSPTCSLSSNLTSGYVPLNITFSMGASDTDGSIASWKLDIDNDGIAEYSGSGAPPSTKQHTYQNTGTYTAKLTVTDNDGATDTDATIITVSEKPNQPPIAGFIYAPESPVKINTILNFTDDSTDSDGSIVNWTWNFGDGTISYGSEVNHTYLNSGKYNVTLTVTDNDGASDDYTCLLYTSPSPRDS